VHPDAVSRVLGSHLVGQLAHGLHDDFGRLASASDFGEAGTGHEAALLPLSSGRRAEWILALIGTVPADADPVLRLIGRVAGARFAALSERRTAEARRHYQALPTIRRRHRAPGDARVHDPCKPLARQRSLTLTRNGLTRRIASIGGSLEDAGSSILPDSVFTHDRFICTLGLGSADQAARLRAAQGPTSRPTRWWPPMRARRAQHLAGRHPVDVRPGCGAHGGCRVGHAGVLIRIEEELERAKRFDLRLSLILIDVTGPSDAVIRVQDALRRELRGRT
jgi:hypothetical protein